MHGVITRGSDIDEDETQEGEKISSSFRADILATGHPVLIDLLARSTPESDAILVKIVSKYSEAPSS